MTLILGIETSCDETGIALYDSTAGLISHTLYSQTSLHAQYGGVVPELASRDHIKRIIPLIDQCLHAANLDMTRVDAIAYTACPGLNGALLVGASVANGLAFSRNLPVIPIHHLEGHLLSPFLGEIKPKLPFIALLVSGGHTQIIAVEEIGKYTLLGDTLDDAAGEAFDKTAKLLGLPYPGGKYLAKLAENGQDIYGLPRPMLHSHDLNFSFSGLKTAVLTLINKIKEQEDLTHEIKQNLAAGIEEAITDVLVKKATDAMRQTGINTLVISGGVSANLTLREKMGKIYNADVFYPPLDFCTDNG
ncbi:MAG TPA: tRNA (adenosine(37)-N6)-threonylcarbamoyltransferase complex transferase subunit TsaD, partial [Aquella sp.]|nr:tRNA (adenosine(37)-N6)-threonylcarbamoyltransferase complex transferase subunit TsaD [Aquella sp.]